MVITIISIRMYGLPFNKTILACRVKYQNISFRRRKIINIYIISSKRVAITICKCPRCSNTFELPPVIDQDTTPKENDDLDFININEAAISKN